MLWMDAAHKGYIPILISENITNIAFPEKRKVYDTNGQDLYLDLCDEMKLVPVRIFHRGLLLQIIDLRVSVLSLSHHTY